MFFLILCNYNKKIIFYIFSVSQLHQSYSFKIPNIIPPINRNENKGAQLMTKMGWEGRGLGVNAQVRYS